MRTKIGRAINGVKEAKVGRVEEIEGLRAEVLAVLRDQYEAGVRPIVNGFRAGVADAVREMMRQALVHIDQQPVILGIPTRSCLEVNCDRKSAHAGSKRACLNGRAIDV